MKNNEKIISEGQITIVQKNIATVNSSNDVYIQIINQEKIPVPKYLTNPVFKDGLLFAHRNAELDEIKQTLEKNHIVSLLQGIGGIGKSALLQTFTAQYANLFDHVLYVELDSRFSGNEVDAFYNRNALLRSFFKDEILCRNIRFKYEPQNSDEEQIRPLFNALQNLSGNNLLVIDNATSILEEYLFDMPAKPNWKILISSRERIGEMPIIRVLPMRPDELLDVFNLYYKKGLEENGFSFNEIESMRDDKICLKILKDIKYHTLTAELLAKTAAEEGWNLQQLSKIIEKEKFEFKKKVSYTTEKRTKRLTLREHLVIRFAMSLDIESQYILRCFSILPSEPIGIDLIYQFLQNSSFDPSSIKNILLKLTRKGWLNRKSNFWECHSIIQFVSRILLKPDALNCESVITNANKIIARDDGKGQHGSDFKHLMPYGQTIVKYLKEDDVNLAKLNLNLTGICIDLGFYEIGLAYCKTSISILTKYKDDENQIELSSGLNELALLYMCMSKPKTAITYIKKAIKMRKKYFGDESVEACISYNNLAVIYMELDDFENALKYSKLDVSISEKILPSNSNDLATSYTTIGLIYWNLKNYQKSIEFNQKSILIRRNILNEDSTYLAFNYYNIALVYEDLGDLEQSISFNNLAFQIYEKNLSPEHPNYLKSIDLSRRLENLRNPI